MLRKFLLPLLFVALLFSIAAQDDKTYSADRFDVDMIVQEDRSLFVEENVAFRFVGGPFSFVFRELPTDHTDGIVDIADSTRRFDEIAASRRDRCERDTSVLGINPETRRSRNNWN